MAGSTGAGGPGPLLEVDQQSRARRFAAGGRAELERAAQLVRSRPEFAPVSRFSSTDIGAAVGPPKRIAPIGPSRNVSRPIVSGAGAVVYFFRGSTTVVKVLPSLVSRTCAGVEVQLVGPDEGQLQRPWPAGGLAPERHRDHELALVGVGDQAIGTPSKPVPERAGLRIVALGRRLVLFDAGPGAQPPIGPGRARWPSPQEGRIPTSQSRHVLFRGFNDIKGLASDLIRKRRGRPGQSHPLLTEIDGLVGQELCAHVESDMPSVAAEPGTGSRCPILSRLASR